MSETTAVNKTNPHWRVFVAFKEADRKTMAYDCTHEPAIHEGCLIMNLVVTDNKTRRMLIPLSSVLDILVREEVA